VNNLQSLTKRAMHLSKHASLCLLSCRIWSL